MFCNVNVKRAKSFRQKHLVKIVYLDSHYARLDIVRKILESTRNSGAREIGLMYGSYLTYVQVDDYLTAMETSGLVRYDGDSETFRITGKGMDFLHSLNEMDGLLNSME